MLKMLETWRETNAPLWLLIGCIIFPIDMKIQSFTIILIGHIIFFMCVLKTLLAPQIGTNSYQYASI